MQKITWYLIAFLSLPAFAQNYEWVTTGSNMNFEVEHAVVNNQRVLLLVGSPIQSTFISGTIEMQTRTLQDTSVKVVDRLKVFPGNAQQLIMYNEDGTMRWDRSVPKNYLSILGTDVDPAGNFVLLADLKGFVSASDVTSSYQDDFKGFSEEELEDMDFFDLDELSVRGTGPRYVQPGCYALTLTADGTFERAVLINKETNEGLEFAGIKCSPNGNYIVFGEFDRDFTVPEAQKLNTKAGGYFLFAYDTKGQYLWGDLAANDATTFCSWLSAAQHVTIAADGSVYMTAAAKYRVVFLNGKSLPAPVQVNGRESYESYVIGYSAQGKLKLLLPTGIPEPVHGIAATNDKVIVAYPQSGRAAAPFGRVPDTLYNGQMVLRCFNTIGKHQWTAYENAARIQTMRIEGDRLYSAGVIRSGQRQVEIAGHQFGKIERSYISYYDLKGQIQGVKVLQPDFDSRPEPVFIYPVSQHEIYVAYNTFCTLSVPMFVYDNIFRGLKCYGGVGFAGKFRY